MEVQQVQSAIRCPQQLSYTEFTFDFFHIDRRHVIFAGASKQSLNESSSELG
jgi:hypothetical protein